MGSIIRSSGTIFYPLVYVNSRIGFNGLKYLYTIISVIDKRLPGNTKKWTLVRSWTARVRLVHSWAVTKTCVSFLLLRRISHTRATKPTKSYHHSGPSPMRLNELWTCSHTEPPGQKPWLSTAFVAGSVRRGKGGDRCGQRRS